MDFHTLPVGEVTKLLATDLKKGLTATEAENRLAQYGLNKLPEEKTKSIVRIFFEQFKSPLIVILLFSSAILFVLFEFIDASIILGILLFNAAIGTMQEGKAQHTLAALKNFIQTQCTVRRDHKEIIISDTQLVPGDIILIQEGEKIPADARIIESHGLRVQESALTGESLPVDKEDTTLKKKDSPLIDQVNMLFKGTTAVVGNAYAVVVATGLQTQIGALSSQLTGLETDIPLKRAIKHLSHSIMVVVAILCGVIFVLGVLAGNGVLSMFKTIVSLAVSAIPEGLPIVLTLVLAQGVWRMAKRHALVKKLQAVEALGHADIIAVDKTGTITKNELVVRRVFVDGQWFFVSGNGYEGQGVITESSSKEPLKKFSSSLHLINRIATLCANAHVAYSQTDSKWLVSGDPTEAAMIVLSQKMGQEKEVLDTRFKRLAEIPFSTKTHYHATLHIHEEEQGKHFLAVSGAPEAVLQSCTKILSNEKEILLTDEKRKETLSLISKTAEQGLRIICFAYALKAADKPVLEHKAIVDLTFAGIYAMEDSIRPEALAAISQSRLSGIKIIMMTGDHTHTARAIARQAGIYHEGDRIVTGDDLESMDSNQLKDVLGSTTVFARMTPEHKLIIIKGFKARGELIAMTGDGVNDAPALVAADLGISMGKIGTEVAREASDIVLLDDNLSSIVSAIQEGRMIYRSIKRVILFLFSTNMAEVAIIIVALLLGLPLPFTAAQILWLNVVTDSFLDVGLGMEPKEKGVLLQKLKNHSLVDSFMLQRMVVMAIPTMIGTLFIFHAFLTSGLIKASTIALTTLVFFQWFNALNIRSEHASLVRTPPWRNPYLMGAFAITFVLHLAALYTPFLQKLLHTVPLTLSEFALCIGIASSIIVVEEARKLIQRLTTKREVRLEEQLLIQTD